MSAEITMKRDDPDIAWGFRLTGGADLGTPFYVVKVLGRGHAERAGLQVGDMVYAINNDYINTFTHKDAQNAILHSGNTLILNILRGPTSGRGTPLPEYSDPFMGLVPPPPTPRPKVVPLPPYEPPPIVKEPTPPESEEEDEGGEDTVAAFNVKINPKGRIAAIEELEVTPTPSRASSRCRSRSRSASRDRRSSSKRPSTFSQNQGIESGFGGIPGPEETFTYNKEVVTQYSTVLSASERTEGQTTQTINESFVIHGGSEHKMEDVLSPEDIERDIFEEKMEEQKITELLTGEAELLDEGIVGINFQKIIPKTDFIKESSVFKELQEQRIKKVEPEEVQLQKDPTKRFSTFLQTPKRPIPKPNFKQPPTEDLPWKNRVPSPLPETFKPPPQNTHASQKTWQEETVTSTTVTEDVNIVEEVVSERVYCDESEVLMESGETGLTITEVVSTENLLDEKVRFQDESDGKNEESSSLEECKEYSSSGFESVETETKTTHSKQLEETSTTTEYKSEFERQLAEVQKQLEAIQQLPSVLQANLIAVQEQLAKIVEAKASADKEQVEESTDHKHGDVRSNLKWQIDVTVEEKKELVEEGVNVENEELVTKEDTEETQAIELESDNYEATQPLQNGVNELYENMKNQQLRQREDDESSVCKPPIIRNFPSKMAERPIVLPGGRKWYTPRDAYNEDFIAETIIHQSEVLVGTTIGLNFRKYEPPKFDAANSAVYRLISEIESRDKVGPGLPIEGRPEKVLAEEDYFPPISKRHFFAARLAEQTNENVEKILHDANEHDIVSV